MDVAILSDMHVPDQAAGLPAPFRELVQSADHVIHAGDFGSADAFDSVQSMAAALTAVYGNADPDDIDLPPVASVTLGDVTFVVVHGIVDHVRRAVFSSDGVVMDRDDWLNAVANVTRQRADAPMVGVGGHSHEVEDTVHDGLRVLNPGSATGVGRAEAATMLTAEVADGELTVTVHEH